MPSLASLLIAASAFIVLALGTLHLAFTYRTDKFHPRDAALMARMKEVSPVITRETTLWNAAQGFHASHSGGAMLFGLVWMWLALEGPGLFFRSPFLQLLGFAYLGLLVALARQHWFSIPRRGVSLAFGLYAAALALRLW